MFYWSFDYFVSVQSGRCVEAELLLFKLQNDCTASSCPWTYFELAKSELGVLGIEKSPVSNWLQSKPCYFFPTHILQRSAPTLPLIVSDPDILTLIQPSHFSCLNLTNKDNEY